MKFMRKSRSKNSLAIEEAKPPPEIPVPPSPPPPNVWSPESPYIAHYAVCPHWQWVMNLVKVDSMVEHESPSDLPSSQVGGSSGGTDENGATATATPSSRRKRNAARRFRGPATLKLELVLPPSADNEENEAVSVVMAVHGTSSALDGMEDKDELVRTLQRCRCDHLNLSPPAVLVSWDVSHDECLNVVGRDLPALPENENVKKFAVLKEPMGSQGKGIYFVDNAESIHMIIDEHRQRALNESDFLDNLIAVKGRIPSWVLQAEVYPSLMIKNRRKFHIRTYVVVLEKLHDAALLDMYLFKRHEVRLAGVPVPENEDELTRDPFSHITNGALSNTTQRLLLDEVEELTSRDIPHKLEVFVAEIFGKHLLSDITRRVSASASQDDDSNGLIRKFAIAGLDIMVTEAGRIYLLEVNANPAAPPMEISEPDFQEHLKGFMHSLVDLTLGQTPPDFILINDILAREGLSE